MADSPAGLSRALAGIPVVANNTERDALFPSPEVNQRVDNVGEACMQRFNGTGWVTTFLSGATSTGTPAAQVDGMQILALPTAFDFEGRVSGAASGSTAVITIPDLPIKAADGSTLEASPTSLKFAGTGVASAVDGSGNVTLTISAGGGIGAKNAGTPVAGTFASINALAGLLFADLGGGVVSLGLHLGSLGLTDGVIPIAASGTLEDGPLSLAGGLLTSVADLLPDTNAGRSIGALLTRWNVGWFAGLDAGLYGAAPMVNLRRRNGTVSAPTDVTNNQEVGRLLWTARVGGADIPGGYIRGVTESVGTQPSMDLIFGASSGSIAPADVARIRPDGLYPAAAATVNLGDTGDGLVWAQVVAKTLLAHAVQPVTLFSFDVVLGATWPHPGNAIGSLVCGADEMHYEAGNTRSRLVHLHVGTNESYLYPDIDGIVHLGKASHGFAGLLLAEIAPPGSPTAGELYRSNVDGGLYYYDGATLQGPLGAGGGGGGAIYPLPDQHPASPTAYDDEFTGATLNARWTTLTAPGVGLTKQFAVMGTILRLLSPGEAASNFWVFSQPISGGEGAHSTAFWVTMKVSLSSRVTTDLELTNFQLGDNSAYAGGTYLDVNLKNDGSGNTVVSTYNGSEHGLTSLGGPISGSVYLHFQRNVANEIRVYASLDGLAWREFYTATAQVWDASFLFIRMYGSTTITHTSIHGIDWARVNDPRFDQGF